MIEKEISFDIFFVWIFEFSYVNWRLNNWKIATNVTVNAIWTTLTCQIERICKDFKCDGEITSLAYFFKCVGHPLRPIQNVEIKQISRDV